MDSVKFNDLEAYKIFSKAENRYVFLDDIDDREARKFRSLVAEVFTDDAASTRFKYMLDTYDQNRILCRIWGHIEKIIEQGRDLVSATNKFVEIGNKYVARLEDDPENFQSSGKV